MSPRRLAARPALSGCRLGVAAALPILLLAVFAGPARPRSIDPPAVGSRPSHIVREDPRSNEAEKRLAEARGLMRLGRVEEALQILRELHRDHPEDVRVTGILGAALATNGRRDEAIALYREAADHQPDPAPALAELERLYREDRDWSRALEVCFEYLKRVGNENGWVTDEMESLIRSDRAGSEVAKSLEEAIKRDPKNPRLTELLITSLLYQGKVEEAVEKATDLDRERKARGEVLLHYAATAEEKRYDTVALDAYDRILKLQPDERVKAEALYRRASTLRRLGRLEESLTAYDAAAAGSGPFAVRARVEKAEALDRDLHRSREALSVYQEALDRLDTARGVDPQQTADDVRLAMAECQLRLENPAEAMRLYQELAEKGAEPETRAASMYQVGEMLFYQGKLKEAEDAYYKLTDTFPTQDWVNDALARILLLGENAQGGGAQVTALAQAEYQRRLGNVNNGLKLVDEGLAQSPGSRAADDLLHEKVLLLLSLGKVPEARTAADTLASRFPESLLAPRGLMAVADEMLRQPSGGTEAQSLYMEILLRFPESLEAADARAALQKIKDRARDSSGGDHGSPHGGDRRT